MVAVSTVSIGLGLLSSLCLSPVSFCVYICTGCLYFSTLTLTHLLSLRPVSWYPLTPPPCLLKQASIVSMATDVLLPRAIRRKDCSCVHAHQHQHQHQGGRLGRRDGDRAAWKTCVRMTSATASARFVHRLTTMTTEKGITTFRTSSTPRHTLRNPDTRTVSVDVYVYVYYVFAYVYVYAHVYYAYVYVSCL
jgi:hypothetical protein